MIGILPVLILFLLLLILNAFVPKLFKEFGSEVCSFVAGLGLTIADIKSDSEDIFVSTYTWKDAWPWIFWLSAFLLSLGIVLSIRERLKREDVTKLSASNKQLNQKLEKIKQEYYRLCSDNIKWTFQDFFSNGEARVSIYQHQGNHFTLLGRYSNKTAYNKTSRGQYVDSEGFIALGWQQHEFEDQQAPPYTGNGARYKQYMRNKCNITDFQIQQMSMRSCSFFIKTLHDDSTSDDPDGIIVFEKIRPNSIDTAAVRTQLATKNGELLSFLKNMKSLTKI